MEKGILKEYYHEKGSNSNITDWQLLSCADML